MNAKDFMEVTNIKHQSTLSHYIKTGVIRPTREGKSYNFTQVEVDQILQHKSNPHQLRPPIVTYDLSQVSRSQIIDEYYKDQTVSKFEKLVLRVEQLEQEVLSLKSLIK